MLTPWGKSDHQEKLADGVYLVDTPSHGGILVGNLWAKKHLTPAAVKIGEKFGGWLAFEEDCAFAAISYEHPEWFVGIFGGTAEEIKERSAENLRHWNADYFRVED